MTADIDWEAASREAERAVIAALAFPSLQLVKHEPELIDLGGLYIARCQACPERQSGPRVEVLRWMYRHKTERNVT